MRSRPAWKRTPNATLISNQFKGIESNGGYLWTFGVGDQNQVTGENTSSAVNANISLGLAFRNTGNAADNPTNGQLSGVARWGNGFVAAQTFQNPITNINWSINSTPANRGMTSCIATSAGFFATTGGNFSTKKIIRSLDGKTWATVLEEGDPMLSIFEANGKIAATCLNKHIYVSTDGGASWAYFDPPLVFGDYAQCITYDSANSRWLIGTSRGGIFENTDVIATGWTRTKDDQYEEIEPGIYAYISIYKIIAGSFPGSQKGLAVSGFGRLYRQSSAGVWTQQNIGSFGAAATGVATNGATFLISTDQSADPLYTSTDLITWTARTPPTPSVPIRDVAFGGGYFVAVGDYSAGNGTAVWVSADAITWVDRGFGTTISPIEQYNMTAVCAATGVIIAGADRGHAHYGDMTTYYKTLFAINNAGIITPTSISDVNMPNSGIMVTAQERIYAVSDDGQNVRFCKPGDATDWTAAGLAGFLPVSRHFGSGQRAYGLGLYQGDLAVFTDTSIQIWTIDPDPTAMALKNVIEGVGTRHHSSIVSLQGDLLFESDSGVRSLTTLQSSLYPTDTDVGLPVKKITPSPSQLTRIARFGTAPSCIGLAAIPFAQYWVAAPDLWDVDSGSGVKYGWASWSYSRQAKLNAWSAHSAAAKISAWTTLGSTVFSRSDGDDYLMMMQPEVFGDEQVGAASAPYTAEMETQWLDMKKPGVRKTLNAIDFDGVNVSTVQIYASVDGNRDGVLLDTVSVGSNQAGWTYSGGMIPVQADGTEFKLKFIGTAGQDVQVNKVTLHYDEAGLA
jgi:hypothetical protein